MTMCTKLLAFQQRVAPWLRSGALQFHEHIVDGIDNAPAALMGMMRGEAIGKRLGSSDDGVA